MKQFMPVLIVFMLLILGGVVFVSINSNNTPQQTDDQKRAVITNEIASVGGDTQLLIGDSDAPSTLVEYYDYKCPACNGFHRTTYKEIESGYVDTGQTNLELRLTPVIGPDSATAGRGAYCANEQNVFEQYHNAVLDHMWDNFYSTGDYSIESQNYLTSNRLSQIVTESGIIIDTEQFQTCTDSDKYNPFLDENLLLAADDGIQGTPGFAIGEQSFVGGQPISVFEQLIEIELR